MYWTIYIELLRKRWVISAGGNLAFFQFFVRMTQQPFFQVDEVAWLNVIRSFRIPLSSWKKLLYSIKFSFLVNSTSFYLLLPETRSGVGWVRWFHAVSTILSILYWKQTHKNLCSMCQKLPQSEISFVQSADITLTPKDKLHVRATYSFT